MFVGRSCVLLGFFVLAHRVVMLGLMMMMRGGMVVRGGEVVVFTRRMSLRFFRHWDDISVGSV
jgi:hypothetical protein